MTDQVQPPDAPRYDRRAIFTEEYGSIMDPTYAQLTVEEAWELLASAERHPEAHPIVVWLSESEYRRAVRGALMRMKSVDLSYAAKSLDEHGEVMLRAVNIEARPQAKGVLKPEGIKFDVCAGGLRACTCPDLKSEIEALIEVLKSGEQREPAPAPVVGEPAPDAKVA